MLSKVIYYYQTFTTLEQILKENPNVTHIHLSSIHFGYDENNKPYIHLNDNDPFDNIFINVWYELLIAYNFGIKIVLMVGGAGGAYTDLFNNFNSYAINSFFFKLFVLFPNNVSEVILELHKRCL